MKFFSQSLTLSSVASGRRFRLLAVVWTCLIGALCSTTEAQSGKKKLTSPPIDPGFFRQARAAAAPAAALPAPLANTFLLHSRRTATKTIYLDFDGHVTRNTLWSSGTIVTSAFSLDSSPSFSNFELTAIQEIWQRVAECYSPFDVDVTTEAPPLGDLINSGGSDTRWGIRCLIGTSAPSPAPNAGGVAFLDSFSWDSDTPCFIFPENLAFLAKPIADATVHEVGHTLGLDHDGRITPAEAYYAGHGAGPTGWAPHMGVGYYQNLVQWSKGEYLSANNLEDDLQIITTRNGFTYRVDDFGSNQGAANAIAGTTQGPGRAGTVFTVNQAGVIERSLDSDWFKIDAGAGPLTLNARGGPANTMLDIQMDLYSSSGSLVQSSNPVNDVTASISRTVNPGTYFLKIDGVGKGNPLTDGYSDYGSIGQYSITGSFTVPPRSVPSNVIATYSAGERILRLTGDTLANSFTVQLQGTQLQVKGANGTTINGSTAFTTAHSGKLTIIADLDAGDDAMSVIGVDASLLNIKLGAGTDKLALTLCNVATLNIDGGSGVDLHTTTSSVVGKSSYVNLP